MYNSSASPKQSKPAPKFADVAGARTLTCFTGGAATLSIEALFSIFTLNLIPTQ